MTNLDPAPSNRAMWHANHTDMASRRSLRRVSLLGCLLMLLGCNGGSAPDEASPDSDWNVDVIAASLKEARLKTEGDVQGAVTNAARSSRAVLFVHVDWAPMEPHRTRFAEFMVAYQRKHSDDPMLFHYVDCTSVTNGYAPLRSLTGWQALHDARGGSLLHGSGELVWLERGRVLHVESILDFDSTAELLRKTKSLMPRT